MCHTGAAGVGGDEHVTIAQRLVEFDEAWLQYLDQFAAWKLEDAASLETELVSVTHTHTHTSTKLIHAASLETWQVGGHTHTHI